MRRQIIKLIRSNVLPIKGLMYIYCANDYHYSLAKACAFDGVIRWKRISYAKALWAYLFNHKKYTAFITNLEEQL